MYHDQIVAVLLGHGLSRAYRGFLLVVELTDLFLSAEEVLPTQIFDRVADRHGLSRRALYDRIRQFACIAEKKDPGWFRAVITGRFRAVYFIEAIARETAASLPLRRYL